MNRKQEDQTEGERTSDLLVGIEAEYRRLSREFPESSFSGYLVAIGIAASNQLKEDTSTGKKASLPKAQGWKRA